MEDLIYDDSEPERCFDSLIVIVHDVLSPPDHGPASVEDHMRYVDQEKPDRREVEPHESGDEAERVFYAVGDKRPVPETAESLVQSFELGLDKEITEQVTYNQASKKAHRVISFYR